ncbi:MAG: preprotein translocase subunit SecE [Candidatus Yonathbacteria bacterium RIFCSPHIGHO2_01_FULL_51_10]|uniref:Protein translocase subunit SecE n=1 Tax=Candidatus Yonathbacteria bacterium RIFCSPHIGHO2_01_FULL_51_10 TaxID=1802723 RepID=A0A1G2S7L7_9BACT|nr:MAG: preprotein translocase subunit SecE [Candidatus Yonathbacteria bacterium RIFCSPHIGHO2_01_FULL_51_10]
MSFSNYLKETKGELKHVSWPSRTQTTLFTILVIVVSIAMGIYLGAFDLLYTAILKALLAAKG